jgi:hypothetical protein
MDDGRFDELVQSFAKVRITRLAAVRGLIGSVIAGVAGVGVLPDEIDAKGNKGKGKGKGKNNGKKVTICHKGQTITVSKKAWKGHEKHGDTMGACSTQTPPSPPTQVTCPTGQCTTTSCGTDCSCVTLSGGDSPVRRCVVTSTCPAGNCAGATPEVECPTACTCVGATTGRCVAKGTCRAGNCDAATPCGTGCECVSPGTQNSRCIATVA